VDLFSAIVTLFLIMDPIGNIPLFLSILRPVAPERRRRVLLREIVLAYGVLLLFLGLGNYLLRFLGLEQETISIAGGIVLFLIAIKMIFPVEQAPVESFEGEPFLLQRTAPNDTVLLFIAVTIAWAISGAILFSSTFFYRVLGERGLVAMERLMGMLLVMVAVQMLLNGLKTFLAR
jgi:multiple antibiotic resistance protein